LGDDAGPLVEKWRHLFANSENLVTFDPPAHTAHRGLMMRLLTPRRLRENEDFMRRAAAAELDRVTANGRCEFLGEFAQPFSMLVIADLLGIPQEDRPALREQILAKGSPGIVGQRLQGSHLEYLEGFFEAYIEDRRQRPRDDVLTQMASARFPDGSVPDVIEVVRAAAILFAGGQGSTARFQANVMTIIAERPDLQDQLRGDPAAIPDFVEEALRLASTTKINFRMARKSAVIGGVRIPAGSTLMLMLAAADVNPRHFDAPNELRTDRPNARDHLSFGRGPHSCPGHSLVRAETRIVLEAVLDRLQHSPFRSTPRAAGRASLRVHPQLHHTRGRRGAPGVHESRAKRIH
jgi:cytochrome P450